ncbi:hypothetical protein F751_6931 [Auxenochlorella protothecoides]|uniref:Uncharacterized protein n=1 Tax=Auxenochlorella protothecoides TaxID=3075 RepID=A0A087SLZ1_AUXPR|nr:hypothetical protein F751_6931 [Auxenochlorella protothecoides]KFM26745.1 hypothetical protein F751_6931 [Auxenochlorella protothecoides]
MVDGDQEVLRDGCCTSTSCNACAPAGLAVAGSTTTHAAHAPCMQPLTMLGVCWDCTFWVTAAAHLH